MLVKETAPCGSTNRPAFFPGLASMTSTVSRPNKSRRVFDDAAKDRYGAHLPFPGLGHVGNNGDKTYTFVSLS
jgi:hypothetical protein